MLKWPYIVGGLASFWLIATGNGMAYTVLSIVYWAISKHTTQYAKDNGLDPPRIGGSKYTAEAEEIFHALVLGLAVIFFFIEPVALVVRHFQ